MVKFHFISNSSSTPTSYSISTSTSTSITLPKLSGNVLNIQEKNKPNDYSRGYNDAVRKCNKRAEKIINGILKAYEDAFNDEED